jgi:F-type H+-transporting ATPase subunit gamma
MELVAASKMKKAQQAALAGRPYAELMASMLAALAPRVDESMHPLLVKREVKTRGILLVTTDKGLCGPLNANLFKLVVEIKTPAKFAVIGRKGAQFLTRTRRDLMADFPVTDRVAFGEVKVAVEFMIKQYLEGVVDTVEVIYPHFKNTLVQEPVVRPVLPLANVADAHRRLEARHTKGKLLLDV